MNFLRFIHTVRNFQTDQIRQKMVYSLAKSKAARNLQRFHLSSTPAISSVSFRDEVKSPSSFSDGCFTFLNVKHRYEGNPPWNEQAYGSLWNIHLNSFEYLLQDGMSAGQGIALMKDFIGSSHKNRTLYDSYVVSQRILNWIKFISVHSVKDEEILKFLYRQVRYLSVNPEYHLRNNHLLENGFALLRAAVLFDDDKVFKTARNILHKELQQQILYDGAHFELSPMYHCIQLRRTLESIDLLRQQNKAEHQGFLSFLEVKAGLMCGWLMNITFDNGDLPQLNDSTDVSHTWQSLFRYAGNLGIKCRHRPFSASGFRKFRNRHFELLVDINGLTPGLAPGHGHADTFHFLLHVFGSPFIVDTGVSTYAPGPERSYERSTQAHNTVMISNRDQSEVYGSFRVGRKAGVFNIRENGSRISASHNGYKMIGAIHHRTFDFGDREIIIIDRIEPGNHLPASAFFHVHKNCSLRFRDGKLISKFVQIGFEGAGSVQLCDTWTAPAFGIRLPAKKIRVDFTGELITRISLP